MASDSEDSVEAAAATQKRAKSLSKDDNRYAKSHDWHLISSAHICRTLQDISKPTAGKKGKGQRKAVTASKDPSHTPESFLPPPKKKKSEVMNQRERNEMLAYLESIDFPVFLHEISVKFDEQLYSEKLKEVTIKLCSTEQPLKDIVISHRLCFVGLYKECKKGPESFLQFQFQWHKYCSAFLLPSQHTMSEIGLHDPIDYQINES